jgi:hypothetical protein
MGWWQGGNLRQWQMEMRMASMVDGWRRYGGYAYGGENGGKYDGEEKWREEYRSTPKATCKLNVLVHLMVFLWVFLLSDLSTPSSYYYSMVLPSR